MKNAVEFFKARITIVEDCWIWDIKSKNHRYPTMQIDGENVVGVGGKTYNVHKWIYELCFGKITDGYHVDHVCENHRCVNPNHLEIVSQTENTRRIYKRKRMRKVIEECKAFLDLVPFEMLTVGDWQPSEEAISIGKNAKDDLTKLIDEFNILQSEFEFRKEIKFDEL